MSTEETKGQGTEGTQDQNQSDPLLNLKSEMARKTEKLAEDNKKLSQQLAEISQMLQSQRPQSTNGSQSGDEDLEDLAYRDPKAYAKKVEERAAARADALINQRLNQQQQTNAILNQLVSDYPELSDSSSELTLKAVEIYKSMSDDEKRSSSAYKIAVRDAAADLGVLPKAKRKATANDDFALGSGSSGVGSPNRSGNRQTELGENTLAFAELMGLNIKDKKVVERLKQRSQRKNWGKYE